MSLGSWPCSPGTPSGRCHRGAEWFVGREPIAEFLRGPWRRPGHRQRLVRTAANGQPASGTTGLLGTDPNSMRSPSRSSMLTAAIRKITDFVEPQLFAAFGLPLRLAPPADDSQAHRVSI